MFEVQILQAVIEQERVGFQFFDREEAALHPVLVDQHDHVLQIVREHVGLVAGREGIEQKRFSVGDDRGGAGFFLRRKVPPFSRSAVRDAFVAAAENGDAPPAGPQGAREFFHDRRLPGAADGQIADADDETAERALAKNAMPVKKQPKLHEPLVDERERIEKRAEKRGANAMAALEDNVDRELLEIFSALAHRKLNSDCEFR